jgi:hypothetical protein
MFRPALVLVVGIFLLGPMCQSKTGSGEDQPAMCGQCLDLPTGNVCTEKGTMKNNCMAICQGVKIECSGPCPCAKK